MFIFRTLTMFIFKTLIKINSNKYLMLMHKILKNSREMSIKIFIVYNMLEFKK